MGSIKIRYWNSQDFGHIQNFTEIEEKWLIFITLLENTTIKNT